MIHGIQNGLGWLGPLHRAVDWTDGCFAVTDPEVEKIYSGRCRRPAAALWIVDRGRERPEPSEFCAGRNGDGGRVLQPTVRAVLGRRESGRARGRFPDLYRERLRRADFSARTCGRRRWIAASLVAAEVVLLAG